MIDFIKALFKKESIVVKRKETTVGEVREHIDYLLANNHIQFAYFECSEVCTFQDHTPISIVKNIVIDGKNYNVESLFKFESQLMRLEKLETKIYNNEITDYVTNTDNGTKR